jgi:uncharacterized protein (TIGR04255 family)
MVGVRKTPRIGLSKAPLVLVLGQARFTPIAALGEYIPHIQDVFRKQGFPLQVQRKQRQIEISSTGIIAPGPDITQWLFKTKDERTSLIIDGGQVSLQTSLYEDFEAFIKKLRSAIEAVFQKTDHDQYGIIQRLGLRYANCIPNESETSQGIKYLRPELHGVSDEAYLPASKRIMGETIGSIPLSDSDTGTMVVRIIQNKDGLSIPPDLATDAPSHPQIAVRGQLATIIDLDHYWMGQIGPPANHDRVEGLFFDLRHGTFETLRNHVVTEEALEAWK